MLKDHLKKATTNKLTYTENGAVAVASTGTALLDFFSIGAALRTRSADEVEKLFLEAFYEDNLLALKMLFYIRDIRGGQGERKTFGTIIKMLANTYPEILSKNLALIPEYGRWDDLWPLLDTDVFDDVVLLVKRQLEKDISDYKQNKSISLLAKWLPSANASAFRNRRYASILRTQLSMTRTTYLDTVKSLRSHLKIVEKQMTTNDWGNINYEAVPSRASVIYRNAFKRHDTYRYQQYLNDVVDGAAKINTGTLYPYDLVTKVLYGSDNSKTLSVAWDNLPDYFNGIEENSLVVADVSGSMSGLPMAVSISLAMYIAERNKGPFHNCYLTFSDTPKLIEIKGKTLYEKVQYINRTNVGYDTNVEAVFDLILKIALKQKMPQSDLPSRLYIVSDMEFNMIQGYNNKPNKTLFQNLKKRFKQRGYKMPELVFWNVNSRNTRFPMSIDSRGFLNVSGCSPSILESLLSGEVKTPHDLMIQTITKPRYDMVTI